MRKKELSAIFASFLMAGTVLTACNTSDKPASEGTEEKTQEQAVNERRNKE